MTNSTSPSLTKASNDLNSFSFGSNTNGFNLKKCTKNDSNKNSNDFGLESIDWAILNDTNSRFSRDDNQWITKLNKEFCWNINKLTEMVLLNSSKQYSNDNINNSASSYMPSNCNINVNNFGMNNMSNKIPRKIVGNNSGAQQTSPNLQPHPSVVNKFYTINQPAHQQQQQQQQQNLMNLEFKGHQINNQQKLNNNLVYQQNYNQQFNLQNNRSFGRIITNNRGYPQRVQC